MNGQEEQIGRATPTAAPLAKAAKAERKSKKHQQDSSNVMFVIGKDEKEGLPVLTQKFKCEGDAILAAYRGGTGYYKIERCKVAIAIEGGSVTLSTSIDDREPSKVV